MAQVGHPSITTMYTPHENPFSADFGIRHSAFRSVQDGTSSGSDPVLTSGVIAVNCFAFWPPRPDRWQGKLQSIAHKLRASFTSSRNSESTKEPRPDLPVFANFMHRVTLLVDVNRCLGKPISDEVEPEQQLNMSELVNDSGGIDALLPVELIPLLSCAADSSATITLVSEVPLPKAWGKDDETRAAAEKLCALCYVITMYRNVFMIFVLWCSFTKAGPSMLRRGICLFFCSLTNAFTGQVHLATFFKLQVFIQLHEVGDCRLDANYLVQKLFYVITSCM